MWSVRCRKGRGCGAGPGPRTGPRLGDLSVQTSSYGTPVPRIYGTMRVAGTVVWATELKELFISGAVNQFILYGNVFDYIPYTLPDGSRQFVE